MGPLTAVLKMFSKPHSVAQITESGGVSRHESEELQVYHQALAQSGDAVLITNFDGLITYVNAAFEKITGYSAADAIGQRPSILKSGQHGESFYVRVWAALKQGRSFRGVFINRNKNGLLFHEEKTISPITNRAGFITHYVSTGRNVNSRIATERQLHQLAYYDALTGLPNRKQFLKRLEEYTGGVAQTSNALILLLDINNLKRINDTLGYSVGDQALHILASRLKSFCQRTCSVARLSGDEFSLLVQECGDADQALAVAQNVLDLLGQSLDLGGQEVFVSASIGVARFPQDAKDPEDLLRHADLALHRAKEAGRNVFLFYQTTMRDSLREDLQIESALHGALERQELHLAFQPVVRSADGVLVGLEALLRWDSHTLGSIPPVRFIPQLERNGLIIPVGRWVLETACREISELHSTRATPLRLAVNVSARQLLHPDFVADVRNALEKSGLAPERLELEITESVVIENAAAGEILRNLRRLGVRIAADDFGTGYSSLSYLWKFPFSTLKIDRSFVAAMNKDPQAEIIVSSILSLARGLSLEVVAEGIETEAQFEVLKSLGCPLIQGYWTGRPLPLAAIKVLAAAPGCWDIRQPGRDEVAE